VHGNSAWKCIKEGKVVRKKGKEDCVGCDVVHVYMHEYEREKPRM